MTSRKGEVVKGAGPFTRKLGQVTGMAWGASP